MAQRNTLDASVFFRLVLIVNLTARPFSRRYERSFGLRLTDWRALHAIAARSGISAAELSDVLGLDKMAISRAVRALEARGRIVRRISDTDGRRSELHLTADGQVLHDAIAASGRAREAELLAGLTRPEQATLTHLLDKLVDRARKLPDDD